MTQLTRFSFKKPVLSAAERYFLCFSFHAAAGDNLEGKKPGLTRSREHPLRLRSEPALSVVEGVNSGEKAI